MERIIKQLNLFWFSPIAPERLAILRVATGLFSLWYLVARFDMMKNIVDNSVSSYEPVGIATLLQQPIAPELFMSLLWVTIALNVAYILGWQFRWTGALFALMFLFIMCYRNSWSMIYHNYNGLVLHIFIIGAVAAADAISLDRWLKNRKNPTLRIGQHWQYGWPVKLICTATVVTYVLSGLAKIFGDLAWDWISGDAMRSQVAVDAIRKEMLGSSATPLFEWLYPHTELFLMMGISTMVLELGAPLALLNRKVGIVWAFLTCSMHWGIYFIMDIDFPYHQTGVIFLSFFALEKLWFKWQGQGQATRTVHTTVVNGEPAVVLFDGVCNFCDSTVRFIIDRDRKGQFQFASIQSEIGQRLLHQYKAPADLSTIVLIEKRTGKVHLRSTAILGIAKQLDSPWRWFSILLIVPSPIRDIFYKLFASQRYRWFGKKDSCEIPSLEVQTRFL